MARMEAVVLDEVLDLGTSAKVFATLLLVAAVALLLILATFWQWNQRSKGTIATFISGIIFYLLLVAGAVHSVQPLPPWLWVAGVSLILATCFLAYWHFTDPLFWYVEGPGLLLCFGGGAVLLFALGISEFFQSQALATSSFASGILAAVGYFYAEKLLNERRAIEEALHPFLSAARRMYGCIEVLGGDYYKGKNEHGVSCFLFEYFKLLQAMEVKREKFQPSRELFSRLHVLCFHVMKAVGDGNPPIVDYFVQEAGKTLVRGMGSSAELRSMMVLIGESSDDAKPALPLEAFVVQVCWSSLRAQQAWSRHISILKTPLQDILQEFGFV